MLLFYPRTYPYAKPFFLPSHNVTTEFNITDEFGNTSTLPLPLKLDACGQPVMPACFSTELPAPNASAAHTVATVPVLHCTGGGGERAMHTPKCGCSCVLAADTREEVYYTTGPNDVLFYATLMPLWFILVDFFREATWVSAPFLAVSTTGLRLSDAVGYWRFGRAGGACDPALQRPGHPACPARLLAEHVVVVRAVVKIRLLRRIALPLPTWAPSSSSGLRCAPRPPPPPLSLHTYA